MNTDGGTQDGNIEEWRPVNIPGWEDKYEVSNLGKVRNKRLCRVLRPYVSPGEYAMVVLYSKDLAIRRHTTKVHRIVARTFIENPMNLPLVNHKDGDISNNAASNLEWVSYRENNVHRHRIINSSDNLQKKLMIIDEKIASLKRKRDALTNSDEHLSSGSVFS